MRCKLEERFRKESVNSFKQEFTEPSMVEPCYNPSIMDMILNPSLAVRLNGTYDEGDDIPDDIEDNWSNDLQQSYELNPSARNPKGGTGKPEEVKGDEPSGKEPENNSGSDAPPVGEQ